MADYEVKNEHIERELRLIGDTLRQRMPPGWGFTLLMFKMGEADNELFDMSSANRPDMLAALKEFIARQEGRLHDGAGTGGP